MKLGDLFWIKKLELKKGEYRYDDTLKIMKRVKEKYDIELSFIEALTLWEIFSNSHCAGWLTYNDETFDDFCYMFEDL